MWHYQDFQAAVLRDQEHAMGLDHLGAYSRAYAIRNQPEEVNISGLRFSAAQLSSNFRNRHFTMSLIPVFICFHVAFLAAAVAGVRFQERAVSAVSPVTTAPAPNGGGSSNPAASPATNPSTPSH
jgi:hypothetical protein